MSHHRITQVVFGIAIFSGSATASADAGRLTSFSGWEVGAQVSGYKYEEPGLMKETGSKLGIAGRYTAVFSGGMFLSVGARLASGRNTYEGSGTMSGVPDFLWEGRILGGRDFVFSAFALAPYVGLGYRGLYNDMRGITSTGAAGYRRLSQYLYLPLGMTHRVAVANASRMASTLEYDLFLRGRQTSYLSDTGFGIADLNNTQRGGHGLKASMAYETQRWSFGVFADYWKITQSDPAYVFVGNRLLVGWEPENHTLELGVFTKYHF